jgi:hypothetical protein
MPEEASWSGFGLQSGAAAGLGVLSPRRYRLEAEALFMLEIPDYPTAKGTSVGTEMTSTPAN